MLLKKIFVQLTPHYVYTLCHICSWSARKKQRYPIIAVTTIISGNQINIKPRDKRYKTNKLLHPRSSPSECLSFGSGVAPRDVPQGQQERYNRTPTHDHICGQTESAMTAMAADTDGATMQRCAATHKINSTAIGIYYKNNDILLHIQYFLTYSLNYLCKNSILYMRGGHGKWNPL